jgi:chromate transporter
MNPTYSIWQLIIYMIKLGTWGFGGPVALAGYMHRDLVEKLQWITEADYKEGLALAQLAPGPMAAQLAIYLGYVHFRILGATLAGIAFVLPSFLMVVALGWAYLAYGELAWMQAVFYGVGAAVIGIIAISAQKLTQKTIGKDRLLWSIYLIMAVTTVVTQSEIACLVFAAGFTTLFFKSPPKWFKSDDLNAAMLTQLPAITSVWGITDLSLLTQIGLFFTKAGAFVFGSGLAIVPFLYGGVVVEHHWLNEKQFVDAVAVAMITPGPVVITVGFIGYLIAGFSGACVAALGTFVPCYLFTIIPAPYFKKYGKNPSLLAFIDGVTAAAVGAITGSVIVIAQKSIIDLPTAAITVVTGIALWKFKKITEPIVVVSAALLGIFLYPIFKA